MYCRVLGGLLSAHLIITDLKQPFGDMLPEEYRDDLLYLSHDLATRLLDAFDNTATGIPYPRVCLPSDLSVYPFILPLAHKNYRGVFIFPCIFIH